MKFLRALSILVIISLLAIGCGSSGGGEGGNDIQQNGDNSGGGDSAGSGDGNGDTSPALVISNLQFSPTSTIAGNDGGSITVNNSLDFIDSDGDVTTLRFQSSDGIDLTLPINGMAGIMNGTITGTFTVSTISAKAYSFEVWIIDSAGNTSNKLAGTFTVASFSGDTSGTYSYDSDTDVITFDLLSSLLTHCVTKYDTGIFAVTNVSYHPTRTCYPINMSFVDNLYGQINCYRIVYSPMLCGSDSQGNIIPSEDYSGTWQCSDNNGNTYELFLNKYDLYSGAIDISGDIVQCDN